MKFVHLKWVLLLADLVDFLFQITLVVMLDEVRDSVLSREKKEILLESLKKTRPVKSSPVCILKFVGRLSSFFKTRI